MLTPCVQSTVIVYCRNCIVVVVVIVQAVAKFTAVRACIYHCLDDAFQHKIQTWPADWGDT